MRNAKMKRGVILLVAAAILMLPLHLSYFSPGQTDGISIGIDDHASAEPCDHAMNMDGRQHCDTHAADDCCGGRVVSSLEGGYDLPALAASVAAHVRVLMERDG